MLKTKGEWLKPVLGYGHMSGLEGRLLCACIRTRTHMHMHAHTNTHTHTISQV